MATNLPMPVELTDAELDAVSAGAAGAAGLVAVAIDVHNINVDVQDILSHNNVEVAVAANALSNASTASAIA